MPSFLHAADIHLDSPLQGLERYEGAPVDRIRDATRRALEALVGLALEREVAFVVIAGDLYDGDWRDYRTGLFFNAQMARLAEAKIPVFIVRGNHDAASEITLNLRPPGNVSVFSSRKAETVVLEELGVAVHGRSYPQRRVDEDLSPSYPAAVPHLLNVGVLHTSVDGRVGHEPYAPCTVDGLRRRGYAYWALGHVHATEVLSKDPWIVFPGNLQGRHARETGPKGARLVTYSGTEITAVEPVVLDVVRWSHARVDVAAARGGDDVLDASRRVLANLAGEADGRLVAARVEITGATAAHGALLADPERWVQEIRSAANESGDIWVEKVHIATRQLASRDDLRARDDAIGALVRALDDEDSDEALARLAAELEDFRAKVPPEALEGSDLPPAGDLAGLREVVRDAKETLLGRLIEGGDR